MILCETAVFIGCHNGLFTFRKQDYKLSYIGMYNVHAKFGKKSVKHGFILTYICLVWEMQHSSMLVFMPVVKGVGRKISRR